MVNEWLGEENNNLFICRGPKSQLANYNTVLIDDDKTNCDEFRAAGGKSVLFPQPWNNAPYDTDYVFGYIEDIIDG